MDPPLPLNAVDDGDEDFIILLSLVAASQRFNVPEPRPTRFPFSPNRLRIWLLRSEHGAGTDIT